MGGIIGGLNEYGPKYIEGIGSGVPTKNIVWQPQLYGWMNRYEINMKYICLKRLVKDVIDSIVKEPSDLIADAGNNNDGTAATPISWGGGYILNSITPTFKSPSMIELSCKYFKEISEAEDDLPADLSITCDAGVYSVEWKGVEFFSFGSGLGVCGTAGLTFEKQQQQGRRVEVYTPDAGEDPAESTYQVRYRWYNPLFIKADGVTVQEHNVMIRQKNETAATKVAYDPGQAFEVVLETDYLDDTYGADLHWFVSGNLCELNWCGEPIWSMEV